MFAYAFVCPRWEVPDCKAGVHAFARSFPSLLAISGKHPKQKIISKGPVGLAAAEANERAASKAAAAASKEGGGAKEGGEVAEAGAAKLLATSRIMPVQQVASPTSPSLNISAKEFHPTNGATNAWGGMELPPALMLPSAQVVGVVRQPKPLANGSANGHGHAAAQHADKGAVVLSKAALQAAARASKAATPAPAPARPTSFFRLSSHGTDAADVKEQLGDLKQ